MTTVHWLNVLIESFNYFILGYVILIMLSYLILGGISFSYLITYLKKNKYVNYSVLLSLPNAPRVSLLAPAYNEANTIKENVHSLLSINYNNFDIIVINDGSKDESMVILIGEFDLYLTDEVCVNTIPTKNIRGIYKSRNPSFSKLIVVDKDNGGKADSLNAGINVSINPYIICIDADCILDKDVILKLAKTFMEQSDTRVIASGGVIRVANSCEIKNGKLISVNAPDNYLARIQVLEYTRAFLLGRMAWSKLDGLLIISGAFGMFDKEIAQKCGGYNHATVGEDMELIVRMRRYMIEQKLKYAVQFIPDPLCWTEVPETYQVLGKQRNRWTRGTMETLWLHKKMIFNPKYKILGLLSFPYWLFFEYLAPIIEFLGIIIVLIMIYLGAINWPYFFWLLLFVYSYAVTFSIIAIFTEEMTYKKYEKHADIYKLILAAIVEPIIFHPFTSYSAIMGNWTKITGNNSWGEMTRKGFDTKKK